MLVIKGKITSAKVFTDKVEEKAMQQIKEVCNLGIMKTANIRIMPDVHAGAGCTIGTTLKVKDAVIPNLVGVDIGCGMEVIKIKQKQLELPQLDLIIRANIPSGSQTHDRVVAEFPQLEALKCYESIKDRKRIKRSVGTLGGGNHFIEVNVDEKSNLYLVIHSGSRNLGTQIAEFYQAMALDSVKGTSAMLQRGKQMIADKKSSGRQREIEETLKKMTRDHAEKVPAVPEELAYLTGEQMKMYIHDMKICQDYANLNRKTTKRLRMVVISLKPIRRRRLRGAWTRLPPRFKKYQSKCRTAKLCSTPTASN